MPVRRKRNTVAAVLLAAAAALLSGALAPAMGVDVEQLPALPNPDPLPSTAPPVAVDPGALNPGVPQQVTVRAGDQVLVEGAGVGCQINSRAGDLFLECGRTGDVRGTYMTLIGRKTAWVAKVRSAKRAQVILRARHGAGWRACGARSSTARAAGAGCR